MTTTDGNGRNEFDHRTSAAAQSKPWMKAAGGLKHLKRETARISRLIEEEFETIEPEDRGDLAR